MTPPKRKKKVRVVRVICQPILVVDDGGSLEELVVDPVAVTAADWEGYATGQFVAALEQLEAQLNS